MAEEPLRLIEVRAENFKRLVAVKIRPNRKGVTRIVGKNGAGKSSTLDAIAAGLGGSKESPEAPIRKGQKKAEVILDLDGIVVERRWTEKGSTVEVRNKEGHVFASPQAMLDRVYGATAFDPLKFTRLRPSEQAEMLAQLVGLDMLAWQKAYDDVFAQRAQVNKQVKFKQSLLKDKPEIEAPDVEVKLDEVLATLDAALAANKEADEVANAAALATRKAAESESRVRQWQEAVAASEQALAETKLNWEQARQADVEFRNEVAAAQAAAQAARRVDVEPIKKAMTEAEATNKKVRAKDARKAEVKVAYDLEVQARDLTKSLEKMVEDRAKALEAAKLPVEGLTFSEDNRVLYKGLPLSNASGAEQLRVATAVAIALNPKLKLAHVQDGSLLDEDGMKILNEMAERHDFQVLVERVANPGEMGVVIEDGMVAGVTATKAEAMAAAVATAAIGVEGGAS